MSAWLGLSMNLSAAEGGRGCGDADVGGAWCELCRGCEGCEGEWCEGPGPADSGRDCEGGELVRTEKNGI
jgi:hypothetical protein